MIEDVGDIDENYVLITERIQEDYIVVEKYYKWYKCKGGICTGCDSIASRVRYLIPKNKNISNGHSFCDECYDKFMHTHYPLSELVLDDELAMNDNDN